MNKLNRDQSESDSAKLSELVQSFRQEGTSLREHLHFQNARIKRFNSEINAFVHVDDKACDRQAESLSALAPALRSERALYGVTISVKDNICTKDFHTTAGSRLLEGFQPYYDATAVSRCRDAGAIIIGKTNCDEFAMGSSTETSVYGVTKNPWDNTRVAGGTSGGAAAAVASDMCDIALGSDTGGSVRQPAAFCGVVGFKPSYGAVSRYGLIAHGSSLDQIGIIAKRVDHVRTVFGNMLGKDPMDPTTRNLAAKERKFSHTKSRIGLLRIDEGCQSDVKESLNSCAAKLAKDGCSVESLSMKFLDIAVPLYYIISTAEAASNLSRYDGVRFGRRSEVGTTNENVESFRSKNFGMEVKRRILLGTFVLSEGYFDQYYAKAIQIRNALKAELNRVFSKFDLILMPTSPTTAFKIGEKTEDPVSMYLSDIFTTVANLTGVPAISIPVGFDVNGLPIGMQMLAPQANDHYLLDAAEHIEQLNPLYQKRPDRYA